ncbi:hypothetical protein I3842_10G126000 [Carya illinoinensis]|uniref:Reverse transcriptase domain-containing protein n=1 Tax=Carya illinoinensis TaxID=32201 RepID=A0A922DXD7_CARIL|nr:hypothetical protein I3842_10G126000 [Carya illinoinensis]
MDALSRMIEAAVEGSFLFGFVVGGEPLNCLKVSDLLFADDTLIFGDPNEEHLLALRALLLCFEAVSRLRINLSKFEIVPMGSISNISDLANIMGCKISSLPTRYLGLPLGASHKLVTIWDGVIEKIERRLTGWKMLYLSKGGRITLLKSTFSNLPTYFLSLFRLPAGVARRIERIFQNFLCGGKGEVKKFHLVNWNKVCQPISCGGLIGTLDLESIWT